MIPSETASAKNGRLPPERSGQVCVRETLSLAQLVTDAGTQVRSEISEQTVSEYVEALEEGARFPPVVVFRSEGATVLADGFHRVRAYQQAGRTEVEADVYQGGHDDALWFALGANRSHGQRLSSDDKRRAIEIAYGAWPDLSQGRIAAQVGCTQPYVGRVRAQLKTRFELPDQVVGKDGRRRGATRPSKELQTESVEGDGATEPPKHNRKSETESREKVQERATSPENATPRVPPGSAPAATPPALDSTMESAPTVPGHRRPSGVTASQSARDRSNRIVSVVADNAKNLTAQEDLIDFTALDRAELPNWIADLEEARRLLACFIRRLREGAEDGISSSPVPD